MRKFYKSLVVLSIFFFSLKNTNGQVTVRYNGSATGLNTTCTDNLSAPDRSFEIEIRPVTGSPQTSGNGRIDYADNCPNAGSTNFSTRDADIMLYCSGSVIRIRARAGESDNLTNCGGLDCATPWSNWTNDTVNNTNNISWGPVFVTGNGSSGNISSTISFLNDFRPNARNDGNRNQSCATAWALPVNGSGTYFNANDAARHTTNCGDAWYAYQLTDANREYIEFEPTAAGTNGAEIVEVRYGSCTGCTVGGTGTWGNAHRIYNPPAGTYYVRVRVNQTPLIGSNDRRFHLVVNKGNNLVRPVNDLLCNATNFGTLNTGATITLHGQTNVGAGHEDFCTVDEPKASGNDATVWYKLRTSSNPGTSITIETFNENASCGFPSNFIDHSPNVYLPNGSFNCSTFSGLTLVKEAGLFSGGCKSVTIDCPLPDTVYYIQVQASYGLDCGVFSGCETGTFSIQAIDNGIIAGPDFICQPYTSNTPGVGGYLGTLSSGNNTPLVLNNQSTRCATVNSFEPDNTTILSALNRTVWYRFRTPPADYSDNTLYHLYDVTVERRNTTPFGTYPALYLYKETTATNRSCPNNAPDYHNLLFLDRDEIDPLNIVNGGNAQLRDLCLEPNTNYYLQIDPVGLSNDLDFNIKIEKSAFRPADDICSATNIGSLTGLNVTRNKNNAPLNAAPYFGLPHTNKCKSSSPGEPNVSPGGPGNSGTHTASVWYKFTTDANPAEWIEWDHNDFNVRGNRGGACIGGALWNSRIFIYQSTNGSCNYPTLVPQSESDLPGDIPFLASIDPGKFRLRCPLPNTTYYVQVYDAEAFSVTPSTCYEGLWEPTIKTAPTTTSPPSNDNPCGAIFLGTVPVGGTLAPNTVYNNFCATPTSGFIADFTQPLERDVWFSFIAPPSGSVLITAQSAPPGKPTNVDDDIDLQIAIWEPVLGQANLNPNCSDPRYLWAPIVSRDHDINDYLDVPVISTTYYDLLDTRNNLLNENNSLIATCLKPGKLYYIQVDGGEYPLCDLFDGGNCVMGYFKLQVKDAGLYDMASMTNVPQGNDEPCGAKPLPMNNANVSYNALQWLKGSNLCATAINDPSPTTWSSSDATVWYKFVAPPSGKVRIRAERIPQLLRRDHVNPNNPNPLLPESDPDYHEEINLQLAVFEMAPSCFNKASLTEIASSYDGVLVENNPLNTDDFVGLATNGFDEYMVVKCLIPGKTYYIMVDGENDPTLGIPPFTADIEDVIGDFRISVQDFVTVPASVNDNICNAFEITGVQGLALNASTQTGLFNNECATIEPNIEGPGKPGHTIDGPFFSVTAAKTLWFKFKAPASGKVKIEALNSGNDYIDLAMALYDLPGQLCTNGTGMFTVEEDYDPAVDPLDLLNLRDETFEVECLVPGRYYYLQVDGANNVASCVPASLCKTGEFSIKITHLPADPRSDIPPQKNDNLCDAINLGNLYPNGNFFLNNHNNRCSTEEVNEPDGSGWNFTLFDDQERTVWYRFRTGPTLGVLAPGAITITANDPNPDPCFDIDLELFEYNGNFSVATCNNMANTNTQFNPLTKVGIGSPMGFIPLTDANRSEQLVLDCPKPNKDYFIRISGSSTCPGFGATMGEFDLTVSMNGVSIPPRVNDDLCPATTSAEGNLGNLAMGGTLQRLNHNNICATQEQGEPNTTQNAVPTQAEYDETMWYRFKTPATPGEVKIRLDAILPLNYFSVPSVTVYKGSSANYNPCVSGFGGLIEVGSDIGQVNLFQVLKDYAEVILPCPSPNWNYFIQVDGADVSLFNLTPPGYTDKFVYNLTVTDDGSGSAHPTNDKVTNAIPVDSIPPLNGQLTVGGTLAIKGHNLCAYADDNEPRFNDIVNSQYNGSNTTDHQSALEDETVWYYFITPNKPGVIRVRVQDDPAFPESFSPNFAIFYNNGNNPTFRITEAPSSTLIQEGPESTAGTGTDVFRDYTCLLPNTKYWIQVDGNDAVPGRVDQGRFIVTVTDNGSGSPGPSNDLICNAENLTSALVQNGSVTFNRTNKCSWEEVGEPNTSGNMGGTGDDVTSNNYDETVWFRFNPAWEGNFTIQVSPSHNFILYRSSSPTYDCTNPNWNNLTRMSSSLGSDNQTFSCLDNGVWYFLQVDGDDLPGDDVGPFNLTITHSDATILSHDMFCSALNLGTINNTTVNATSQNNACATQELNEPNTDGNYYDINSVGYDKTLWYRFTTPPTIGDWTISVTNNAPFTDRISATFNVYQLSGTACTGGNPNWSNITNIQGSGIANVLDGNNSVTMECFRLQPNTVYYIQVHGEDFGPFGEVGTNFTVSVTHNPASVGSNDNICSATLLVVGAPATAHNNICAGTQPGEPDIAPDPQNPNTNGYDETMWYRFVAPSQGYVKIEGRSQVSNPIDLNMDIYELPSGVTNACVAGVPNWSLLNKIGHADNLISFDFDYESQCLVPGRTYYFKIDGGDLLDDRGNYTVRVLNQYTEQGVICNVQNDEPCNLPPVFDLSAYVRDSKCTSTGQFYPTSYQIFDGNPDVDCATKSNIGSPCGNKNNCSDYWFRFVVPTNSDGGIKIQGEDEYGPGNTNNSQLVLAAYRGNPCDSLPLQLLGCDYGGVGRDVEFDIAALPGETIYLQAYNANEPASPSSPNYGICISTQCTPKLTCPVVPNLQYGIPQCWNLDEDNNPVNNNNPQYGNCLPGGVQSANYFTFSTECGISSDGMPDTVTLVFSILDIGSNTALAIYEDATPCDFNPDGVLVNCVPFGNCIGCSPSQTFSQTYLLQECKTYVIQILGEDDDNNGSKGQVLILKTSLQPPILPIELLSFTGYNDGDRNMLNWITSSETNTDKFVVERSPNGNDFEPIGVVAAAGYSTSPKEYGLADNQPYKGVNYYRLKMFDLDGSYDYSRIITIDASQSGTLQTGIVGMYPNPTNGMLNVVFSVAEPTESFNMRVMNIMGQLIHSKQLKLDRGIHTFGLDASAFAQGVYIINFQSTGKGESFEGRFIKQ